MRVSRLTWVIAAGSVLAVLLLPAIAGAQTPPPGETPEPVREWVWFLAFPVILGTLGLLALVGFSYLRLSSRFYAKEEPPKVRRQPVYAGVNAPAYPAPVTQQTPAPVAAQAQATAPAETPAAAPAAQQAPQATQVQERPTEEAPAQDAPSAEAEEKAAPETPEEGASAATQEAPAEEAPPEEARAEEAPEDAAPREEAATQQAGAPAPQAAEKKAASDDDVYERVLQEQLEKGVSPKVAEGRAKAAALKAARQAGG